MTYLGSHPGGSTFRDMPASRQEMVLSGDGDGELGWVAAVVAAAAALASYLASNKSVRGFFAGESADAFLNYYNRVAEVDAGVAIGTDPKEVLVRIVQAGWLPVYCSDSPGTRDEMAKAFEDLGWKGAMAKRWSNRYAKGGGNYSWWYGFTLKLADVPQTLFDEALRQACGTDLNARMEKTVKLLTDAKHHMKTYGGVGDKANPASFKELALIAIPITPEMCTNVSAGAGAGTGAGAGAGAGSTTTMTVRPYVPPVKPFYQKPLFWIGLAGGFTVLATVGIVAAVRRKK